MILTFPEIDPVAVSFFGLDIRWYALSYLAGFLLGWQYIVLLSKKWALETVFTKEKVDDFLVWAVLGAVLGGRIGYVLFYNLGYYIENPSLILQIWQGGMSFHGGLLGVTFAMLAFARFKELPFLRLADFVACAAPIGLFFGRVSNFINGELVGRATNAEWGMIFSYIDQQPRHPSQLYEALFEGLVLLGILFWCSMHEKIRNTPGMLAAFFLAGYGFFRFFIEYTRQPDAQIGLLAGGLSMGQLLCLFMILSALLIIFFIQRKKKT